ncbi:MAG: J domain-containing protein [Candidatus Marinimicrobia bacterium]|nr:J domain-containing protein [Candidatus Neomarinimicrobiota bacterium]MCF7903597.1 J domain-containing protein [Candidatus Neomarinimicrobiota bacterium]
MPVAEALEHLGLTNEATEADVKLTYKDLARIWHPDRFQSDPRLEAKAEEQIKVINEARSVALKYVKKHGHFRFVGQQRGKRPAPEPPPRPEPDAQQKEASQEPPPKSERSKQDRPPEPEYTAAPGPEPVYEPGYDYADDASEHMPAQNIIIAVVLLLVLVGFVFVMMTSMKDSRKEQVEAYLKQREELKQSPPSRAPALIEEPVEEKEAPVEEASAYADTFFTLGSSKAWVSEVQGAPFQIKGDVWKYGFSTITFSGNTVIGWKSSELHPLSVGMLKDPDREYVQYIFGIGATKKEVAAIYGAPDIINGDLWTYGEAYVRFKADTIVFWQNDQHNTFDVEFADDVKHMRIYITPEETAADTVAAP